MKLRFTRLAFTLIELLVVISIIAILIGFVTVSYSQAQKQGRDTQRRSDLRQYQSGLEVRANKSNGIYPGKKTAAAATLLCPSLGLSNCPEDPKYNPDIPGSSRYQYQSDGTSEIFAITNATKYVLWAKLENTADYFVLCSDGRSGTKSQTNFSVTEGNCPL